MTAKAKMLALVTDAFGGRGGIAQYNRDFLSAVVNCDAVVVDHGIAKTCTRSCFAATSDRTIASKARAHRLRIGSAESGS